MNHNEPTPEQNQQDRWQRIEDSERSDWQQQQALDQEALEREDRMQAAARLIHEEGWEVLEDLVRMVQALRYHKRVAEADRIARERQMEPGDNF